MKLEIQYRSDPDSIYLLHLPEPWWMLLLLNQEEVTWEIVFSIYQVFCSPDENHGPSGLCNEPRQ